MREIKFRAKMKKEFSAYHAGFDYFTLEELMSGRYDFSKYEHWCEYTGLKDKNGVEIYEGDICRNGDWENDAKAYNYRTEVVKFLYGAFTGWSYSEDGMTCEVIGNMYENSELLRKE